MFIPSRIQVAIDADLAVVGKTIGRHGAVDRQIAAIGRYGRAGFVREREGTRNGGCSGERDSVVDGTEVSVFCAQVDFVKRDSNEFITFFGTDDYFTLVVATQCEQRIVFIAVSDGKRFKLVLICFRFNNFE